MPQHRAAVLVWTGIGVWIVASYLAVAGLPLISEDWNHLALTQPFASVWEIFDRDHVPPRPVQHLLFYLAEHGLGADPWWMRGVSFALHLAAVVLAHSIARQLGASRDAALVAAALLAVAPVARALAWPAAISGPARVAAGLWVFSTFLAAERRRPLALLLPPALLLALLCHQSALLWPAFFALWAACVTPGDRRERGRAVVRLLARWEIVVALALAGAFHVWIRGADQPQPGLPPAGALAANAGRAAVALLPMPLRLAVVDGLRHPGDLPGLVAACVVLGGVVAAGVAVLRRGSGVARFALVAIAADLLLPALASTGFSQRYAYLAFALVAVTLGHALTSSATRLPQVLATIALCSFAADAVVATCEFRAAGRWATRLFDEVAAARAATPSHQPVWVLDPPGHHGPERDVPLWNWGLERALAQRGVAGPIRCVRTVDYLTRTDVERIDAAAAERLRDDQTASVVECRADGSIVFLRPGRRGQAR